MRHHPPVPDFVDDCTGGAWHHFSQRVFQRLPGVDPALFWASIIIGIQEEAPDMRFITRICGKSQRRLWATHACGTPCVVVFDHRANVPITVLTDPSMKVGRNGRPAISVREALTNA